MLSYVHYELTFDDQTYFKEVTNLSATIFCETTIPASISAYSIYQLSNISPPMIIPYMLGLGYVTYYFFKCYKFETNNEYKMEYMYYTSMFTGATIAPLIALIRFLAPHTFTITLCSSMAGQLTTAFLSNYDYKLMNESAIITFIWGTFGAGIYYIFYSSTFTEGLCNADLYAGIIFVSLYNLYYTYELIKKRYDCLNDAINYILCITRNTVVITVGSFIIYCVLNIKKIEQ